MFMFLCICWMTKCQCSVYFVFRFLFNIKKQLQVILLPENLVLTDLPFSLYSNDVYSRVCQYTVTSQLGVDTGAKERTCNNTEYF